MNFVGKDIISIRDFSKDDLLYILSHAKKLEAKPRPDLLRGKVMASLFFEPSTRTRLSFEASMQRLGGSVIGFADAQVTSVKKGETLWDTIKMVESYSDVIVMRNPIEGAARLAAEASSKPVVNAGDGANQHPTQTLVDLYTILKAKGRLDKINIGFLGDLKYGRTVHSLAVALSHFKARMYFISPEALKMPKYYIEFLRQEGIGVYESDDPYKVADELDILYVTRIQQERFPDPLEYNKYKDVYKIGKEFISRAKKDCKIMHPLPRVGEIDPDIDTTSNALYFEQAANGIPVRQAVLSLVLGMIK